MEGDNITVIGKINKIIYSNNNYNIFYFKVNEVKEGNPFINKIFKTITVKGILDYTDTNMEYVITAKEENDKYGISYKLLDMRTNVDLSDVNVQKNFLKAILTEKQVENLYNKLPNPLKVIEEGDIQTLCTIDGIGEKVAERIINKFNGNKSYGSALGLLRGCGISNKTIKKLADEMGESTLISIVTTNPYKLSKYNSFGWAKCDEIALNMGLSKDSLPRVETYILFKLELIAREEGHTFIEVQDLICLCESNLEVEEGLILRALGSLRKRNMIVANKDRSIVGLSYYINLERNVAEELVRLISSPSCISIPDNYEQYIKDQESIQGWNYTEEQKIGVRKVLSNNVCIVQGFAGAGKSSIIAVIYRILKGRVKYCQVALSGKASVNLTLVTGEEGKTIHRFLGLGSKKEKEEENAPLMEDVIVIDEISMVDLELFYKLIKRIKSGAKLILLGDIGQLESIGVGNLMSDMINSEAVTVISLKEIHRQAEASGIITNSLDIWHGRQIFDMGFTGREVRGKLRDFFLDVYKGSNDTFPKIISQYKKLIEDGKSINDIEIVVPMKKRGDACTQKINKAIQKYLLENTDLLSSNSITTKDYEIRVGDKVINIANNYQTVLYEDKLEFDKISKETGQEVEPPRTPIMNGNMGIVTKLIANNICVNFEGIGEIYIDSSDLDNIELGYAITAHKSQGSGFPYLICGIDYTSFVMLNKEMLYTMLTRAKKQCYLFGESRAIRQAIRTSSIRSKRTTLKQMLDYYYKESLQIK